MDNPEQATETLTSVMDEVMSNLDEGGEPLDAGGDAILEDVREAPAESEPLPAGEDVGEAAPSLDAILDEGLDDEALVGRLREHFELGDETQDADVLRRLESELDLSDPLEGRHWRPVDEMERDDLKAFIDQRVRFKIAGQERDFTIHELVEAARSRGERTLELQNLMREVDQLRPLESEYRRLKAQHEKDLRAWSLALQDEEALGKLRQAYREKTLAELTGESPAASPESTELQELRAREAIRVWEDGVVAPTAAAIAEAYSLPENVKQQVAARISQFGKDAGSSLSEARLAAFVNETIPAELEGVGYKRANGAFTPAPEASDGFTPAPKAPPDTKSELDRILALRRRVSNAAPSQTEPVGGAPTGDFNTSVEKAESWSEIRGLLDDD